MNDAADEMDFIMNADLRFNVTAPPGPTRCARTTEPFDGLLPWLSYVDHVLQRYLLQQQQRGDDRFDMEGLLVPADEWGGGAVEERTLRWLNGADDTLDLQPMPVAFGPLATLTSRFGLCDQECAVLILSLLPLFDARYGALIAYLQGEERGSWPNVDLALTLFGRSAAERIRLRRALSSPQAQLIRHGLLLRVAQSGRASEHGDACYLRGTDLVFDFLTGDDTPGHKALVDLGEWLPAPRTEDQISIPEWQVCESQLQTVCFGPSRAQTPVVLLQGGDGRDVLLVQLASAAGVRVFALNLAVLPDDGAAAWSALRAGLLLTRLTGAMLLLRGLAEFETNHSGLLEALDGRLADHGQPVVALVSADVPVRGFAGVPRVVLSLPPRTRSSDAALVRALLDTAMQPTDPELDLTGLLQRTRINPDRLEQTLTEAEQYRRQRDPKALLAKEDLHRALHLRAQQHFGKLAQRIEPRRRLGDLIASEALHEQLREILAAIRQREVVFERGFGCKVAYGKGISALFYGESGTGKSMAAEVLAAELGVDLIRVDLATVVNKYIGETEKNLSKIFDLAVADTGVLLFDEADALFGKRSEVKDAHDRHANIEVSYLLQRLEHYPGLVVLSTNSRGHLDDAFTRRLTFMTRFEAPDTALRLKMWREIWPTQAAVVDGIEWERLAECADLTGAGIRNVALLASWLAAEEQRAVTQADIERAIKRELAKTGRLVPR
ncbi:ATP-binding protein [Chromobacterium haemolyticum]|uniref:ATP-binding protein n=1 Tax=Chromobacterium haemolyticum TaxID=394935 RepID=UPI00244B2BBD|nr:ATP-binding protein [Chromobacterium haemolyticum]MDH0343359.1 ATP-binding protein [Chromobacterium haemolyticum]